MGCDTDFAMYSCVYYIFEFFNKSLINMVY